MTNQTTPSPLTPTTRRRPQYVVEHSDYVEPVVLEAEFVTEPHILPLWGRRVFYVVGTLAGAAALIVGGYDPELAKNIAGAGAILVSSLALANPSR